VESIDLDVLVIGWGKGVNPRRSADDPRSWSTSAVAGRDALTDKLRARNYAMLADIETVTLIEGEARCTGNRESKSALEATF
jgi:pyruvate/2-oxoglutarate dehydrogenase complex dihydrolipoamide dehydrogenase (E3) component